eukprot:414321_1
MRVLVFMSLYAKSSSVDITSFYAAYQNEITRNPIHTYMPKPPDAETFFTVLFNCLQRELKNTKYENLLNNAILSEVTIGLSCQICKNKRDRQNQRRLIQLQMRNCAHLNDSMQKYTESKSRNYVYCNQCHDKTTFEQTLVFSKLANILFIHVDRFQSNFETCKYEKVNTKWIVPDEINLKQYTKLDQDVHE